ncbi:MAG: L-seryl-tRNA(Sec) selenium transferase [Gemmatimonadales bacterium]
MTDPRRDLPAVDRLLELTPVAELMEVHPRSLVVAAVRAAILSVRGGRQDPPEDWVAEVRERVRQLARPSLQPVLNATGIILHTNLGRAPLAGPALHAMVEVAGGYSTLEFDLPTGGRGHRGDHCRELLAELSGSEDSLVVNNAAGALVLALNSLADGRPVAISRGELIEIGGSFRIPDIMEKSGATLFEVGTTNRTHLEDYRGALEEGAAMILTVHRSNFELRGFVTTPPPAELAELSHAHGVPFVHDVGSGLMADLSPWGLTGEPRVPDAIAAGADLVIFSGDKLLGGPQAGCIAGTREMIMKCRRNPFARAIRADKLTLAALEATLVLYRDPEDAIHAIPVLRMLTVDSDTLSRRAQALAASVPAQWDPRVEPGMSAVGGGSFPAAELPTTLVSLAGGSLGARGLALLLRTGTQPIVTRVHDGRVLFDPRTLPEAAFPIIAERLQRLLGELEEDEG